MYTYIIVLLGAVWFKRNEIVRNNHTLSIATAMDESISIVRMHGWM